MNFFETIEAQKSFKEELENPFEAEIIESEPEPLPVDRKSSLDWLTQPSSIQMKPQILAQSHSTPSLPLPEEPIVLEDPFEDAEIIMDADLPEDIFSDLHMIQEQMQQEHEEALQNRPPHPNMKKREHAIKELISTEETYRDQLHFILQNFSLPLKQRQDQKGWLNREQISLIFGCFPDLFKLSRSLAGKLKETLGDPQQMASLLIHYFTYNSFDGEINVYLKYCARQKAIFQCIQQQRAQSQVFSQFLKKAQQQPIAKGLDLTAFLLIPMQRITRYPLLVKQILHYTSPEQKEYLLWEQVVEKMEAFLKMVNEETLKAEQEEKMKKIVSSILPNDEFLIDLNKPTKYGPRTLLFDGHLSKVKSGKKLRGFLFTDLLLLCTTEGEKFRIYKQPLPLESILLREQKPPSEIEFFIKTADLNIHVKAQDSKKKQEWIQWIELSTMEWNRKGQQNKDLLL